MLALWLLSAVVGAVIGSAKDRPFAGAVWGLLLGPIGWLVILAASDTRPTCPECRGKMVPGANRCKNCGTVLAPPNGEMEHFESPTPVVSGTAFNLVNFVIVALLASILLVLFFEHRGTNASASFRSIAAELEADAWRPSAPSLTLREYMRLDTGMSYWEVRSIMGESGEEISRSTFAGVPGVMESIETVMYSWSNDDGSNMNAMFQNGRLIQKAQFGLR